MRSPNVNYNEQTKAYESRCPDGRLKTFFFLPDKIHSRFSIPSLHIYFRNEPEPFKFVGRYSASKGAMRFALIGPKGYRYRLDLKANTNNEEPSSSWKTTRKGITDRRTEAIIVPEIVVRNRDGHLLQTSLSDFSPWQSKGNQIALGKTVLLLHIAIGSSASTTSKKRLPNISDCNDISTRSTARALVEAGEAAGATTTTTTLITPSSAGAPGSRSPWSKKLTDTARSKRSSETLAKVERCMEIDAGSQVDEDFRRKLDSFRKASSASATKTKLKPIKIVEEGISEVDEIIAPICVKESELPFDHKSRCVLNYLSNDDEEDCSKTKKTQKVTHKQHMVEETEVNSESTDRAFVHLDTRRGLVAKIQEAIKDKISSSSSSHEAVKKSGKMSRPASSKLQDTDTGAVLADRKPNLKPCQLRYVNTDSNNTSAQAASEPKANHNFTNKGACADLSLKNSEAWQTVEFINNGEMGLKQYPKSDGKIKLKHSTIIHSINDSEDAYPSVKDIVYNFNKKKVLQETTSDTDHVDPVTDGGSQEPGPANSNSCLYMKEKTYVANQEPLLPTRNMPIVNHFKRAKPIDEQKLLRPSAYNFVKNFGRESRMQNRTPFRYCEKYPSEWNDIVKQIEEAIPESSVVAFSEDYDAEYPTSATDIDTDYPLRSSCRNITELIVEVQERERNAPRKYYLVQYTK